MFHAAFLQYYAFIFVFINNDDVAHVVQAVVLQFKGF